MKRPARPAPSLTVRVRDSAAVFLVLTATAGMSACSSSDGDSKASTQPPTAVSPSSSPSSSPTDAYAEEKAAALAAYSGMTTEQAKAYRQASIKGTALEKYATLDALSRIELDSYRMKEAGTVVRGEIGHDAEVTGLDMTSKTPRATLSDCVDLSRYETYDTKAKKVIPLPTNQPVRYRATAEAERWDGHWMVTDIDTRGGGSC
ncbi:hypothetical protein GCM10010129_76260 [Streptomyces fumigatiscleroticus]|nr:hypothetical protein GCM10010129_76260 [Streptomyces fumigatiscleroticus]